MVVLPVRESYLDNYHRILSTIAAIPCEYSWKKIAAPEVENWIVNMGIERMQSKAEEVFKRLSQNRGGWDETWIQLIARSFGFGINQEAFDRLGQSLPLTAIRSTGSNLFRLEAILYGQAGLIPDRKPDPYSRALMTEYGFVRGKFNLQPVSNPGWKFLRMRPSNFPTVRIAQFAAFLAGNPERLGQVLGGKDADPNLRLDSPLSTYWQQHYDFGKKWTGACPAFGESTRNLFIINAVLPFRASYAHRNGDTLAWEHWMDQLERLPAEDNRITRIWVGYGYRIPNAFYSQAFFHLYTHYCSKRLCLSCHLGQLLIRGKGS
jgi:hypothetical protein